MDFRFNEEDEAFRKEVSLFLDKELTSDVRQEYEDRGLPGPLYYQFMRKVGERGWLKLAWPKEIGGEGSYFHKFILLEEMARRGVEYRNIAESIVAPTLILFGNEEQKRLYLPQIARGEVVFCLLFTEPYAGSDLASLELSADPQNGGYILRGQKCFSSEADVAHYAWVAARTNPHVPKHRGISLFLLDMKSKGITIQPLISLAGDHRFNIVYVDDVWVDKKDRVGEENKGWYYIVTALDYERVTIGASLIGNAISKLQEIMAYVKHRGAPICPSTKAKLSLCFIELEVLKTLSYRSLWLTGQGKVPNYEASMVKVFGSQLTQRIAQIGMELLGLYGQLSKGSYKAPLQGGINLFYLRSISDTIKGGTSEIQKNIIALRGLGLPSPSL